MSQREELIEELKSTKNLANRILACKMQKRNGINYYDNRVMKQDIKMEQKLYSIFKSLIDPETAFRLVELDGFIGEIANNIFKTSGWWMTGRTGFRFEDNFVNQDDPEFASHDSYSVSRNESGFYNQNAVEKPANQYFASISQAQDKFLERYDEQLGELHKLLCEKENIMGGNYTLISDSNANLASLISAYLSFESNSDMSQKKTM